MLTEKKESRENLLQYYKEIRKCTICKKEYGYDPKGKNNREERICPICFYRLHQEKRKNN